MRRPEHSIFTVTGRRVWPLDPDPSMFHIEDIAHSLSQQCRFTGHTSAFYSVAQHSVLVSEILAPEHALWGLLHDASEAYLSDIARPAKVQMPEYRQIEDRLERAIAEAFGLPWPMPVEVKGADTILLMTEKRDLMPRSGEYSPIHSKGVMPLEYRITPWHPERAKSRFLSRYSELTGRDEKSIHPVTACSSGLCGLEHDLSLMSTIRIAEDMANRKEI